MKKVIDGYVCDIPEGCITNTDIFSDKGVLLCPKMTIINEHTLASLAHYHGRVYVSVTLPDEAVTDQPLAMCDEDDSIVLSDAFKEYSVEILTNIFNNLNKPELIVSNARDVCRQACGFIQCHGKSSVGINLSKLKVSDEYTYKHSVDVGIMAGTLAMALGFDAACVEDVTLAGLLHDLGKERVPSEILNKPSKLTAEEFSVMKLHPVHGYSMLMSSSELSEVIRQGILNHHENVDGTGYPRGLRGDDIGDMAKIISIVDVFDALVTARPYKDGKTPSQAIEIMFTMLNKFDERYFRAFLGIVNAYPNGTIIQLSNGETAIVIRQNKAYPLRPVIRLTATGEVVDLSHDLGYLAVTIMN